MRRGRFRLPLFALAGLLGLAALHAAAQDDGSRDGSRVHGIFTESLDVRLVNVDVVVTDKAGLPVEELGKDDFRVFEDGEEVEVLNFYAATEEGRRSSLAAEATEVADPVYLLVLVDDDHITPAGRTQVLDELREELDRWLVPGARVMVVQKNNTPRIVQRFTDDRRAIEAALEEVDERGGAASDLMSERILLRRLATSTQPGDTGRRGGGSGITGTAGELEAAAGGEFDLGIADAEATLEEIRQFAAQHHSRVERTAAQISHFTSALAGLPGRKAILYVADRLPILGGYMAMQAWSERYGEAYASQLGALSVQDEMSTYDTSPSLEQIVEEANAARVMFYPVGLTADLGTTNVGASSMGMLAASNSQDAGSGAGLAADSMREGLWMLAAGTGGRAGTRAGEMERLLEAVHDDLTTYYSLGYVSPDPEPGERRRVRVEVDRPGVEVRHLEQYRSKTADLAMVDKVLTALLLGEGGNPVGVEIEVGEPEAARAGVEVPVTVKFPMSRLVLVPQADSHVGAVILYLVVKTEDGRLSPPTRVRVPVEIDNREMLVAMSRTAGYRTRLLVRPGRNTVAVGLRDEVGGVESVADLTVDVERPDQRASR